MRLPEHFEAAERQPDSVEIKIADGILVKSMLVHRAGTFIPQHAHQFDHLSMLAAGRVRVFGDGELIGEFSAPSGILIKAGVKHAFETLTHGVLIYCIHNIERTGEIEIAEEHALAATGG